MCGSPCSAASMALISQLGRSAMMTSIRINLNRSQDSHGAIGGYSCMFRWIWHCRWFSFGWHRYLKCLKRCMLGIVSRCCLVSFATGIVSRCSTELGWEKQSGLKVVEFRDEACLGWNDDGTCRLGLPFYRWTSSEIVTCQVKVMARCIIYANRLAWIIWNFSGDTESWNPRQLLHKCVSVSAQNEELESLDLEIMPALYANCRFCFVSLPAAMMQPQ